MSQAPLTQPSISRLLVIKYWSCRLGLLILGGGFTYVATRPQYNFAHLVPHTQLRQIGISYDTLLWAEQNADIALHFFGAFALTLLLAGAQIYYVSAPKIRPFISVCLLCLAAELVQHLIGRGIETGDLLLGICGGFMAYLVLDNKN